MRHALIAAAAILGTTAAVAQAPASGGAGLAAPGPMLHGDTSQQAKAGTYMVEPGHTQVAFAVSHMGISPYAGWFSGASGSLVIDPAKPDQARLTVTLPIASVMTTSEKLTEELKASDWFDAAKFPTATFTSTSVRPNGHGGAAIAGNLTLHGVTRPVTIYASLFGTATNQMSHAPSLGFVGRATILRSEFGVSKYVPLVSDEVELIFNAAFERH